MLTFSKEAAEHFRKTVALDLEELLGEGLEGGLPGVRLHEVRAELLRDLWVANIDLS